MLALGFVAGRLVTERRHAARASVGAPTLPAREKTEGLAAGRADGDGASRPADAGERQRVLDRLLGAQSSEAKFQELLQTLLGWAATEPEAALQFARDRLPSARQSEAMFGILTAWAKQDGKTAWDWTKNNAPKDPQMIDAVLSEIGKTDAETAWRFASEHAAIHSAEAASIYVSALRGMLHAGNYEFAASRVGTAKFTAADGRYDLSGLVAGQWAAYDPLKAAAWVETLPKNGLLYEQALISLGESWSVVAPREASEYALGLPAGKQREKLLVQAIPNWAERDPVSAIELLLKQESHPDFDQAINRIATSPKMAQHAQAALQVSTLITDQELQTQAVVGILAHIKDQKIAASYLQNSAGISQAVRDEAWRRLEAR